MDTYRSLLQHRSFFVTSAFKTRTGKPPNSVTTPACIGGCRNSGTNLEPTHFSGLDSLKYYMKGYLVGLLDGKTEGNYFIIMSA